MSSSLVYGVFQRIQGDLSANSLKIEQMRSKSLARSWLSAQMQGREIAAGGGGAEGKAVLEIATLVAEGDAFPLCFFENVELSVGLDVHVLDRAPDGVLQRREFLIEDGVSGVGGAGKASFVVGVRSRLLLAVRIAGCLDLPLVER